MVIRGAKVMILAVVAILATAMQAQAQRWTPGQQYPGQAFVEVADPGAAGDFQILSLKVTAPSCTPVNPYSPIPAKALVSKATPDILIYDRNTGHALFVITTPFSSYVAESFQFVTLRSGVVWTATDLDGDGSDDLIGHWNSPDRRRGEIVRAYRKGAATGCQ